jgi:hypothetical protein
MICYYIAILLYWLSAALTTRHPSVRKIYYQISPTSGGRSVGIVRLRTKGHGVFLFLRFKSVNIIVTLSNRLCCGSVSTISLGRNLKLELAPELNPPGPIWNNIEILNSWNVVPFNFLVLLNYIFVWTKSRFNSLNLTATEGLQRKYLLLIVTVPVASVLPCIYASTSRLPTMFHIGCPGNANLETLLSKYITV